MQIWCAYALIGKIFMFHLCSHVTINGQMVIKPLNLYQKWVIWPKFTLNRRFKRLCSMNRAWDRAKSVCVNVRWRPSWIYHISLYYFYCSFLVTGMVGVVCVMPGRPACCQGTLCAGCVLRGPVTDTTEKLRRHFDRSPFRQ